MAVKMREEEIRALDSGDIGIRMKSQKANRDYLRANYHDLLKKYRNQWIVISGGQLLKAESNPARLFDDLSKIEQKDSLVYYLADPEDFMIL